MSTLETAIDEGIKTCQDKGFCNKSFDIAELPLSEIINAQDKVASLSGKHNVMILLDINSGRLTIVKKMTEMHYRWNLARFNMNI